MKYIPFLLLLLTLFTACHKEAPPADPRDASRIEGGVWSSLLPAHPDWRYTFDNGLLRQYVSDFGAVVSDQTYPYALRHDTLIIGGSGGASARCWVVYFYCDSIVQVQNVTPGAVIAPTLYLKKTF